MYGTEEANLDGEAEQSRAGMENVMKVKSLGEKKRNYKTRAVYLAHTLSFQDCLFFFLGSRALIFVVSPNFFCNNLPDLSFITL